MTKVGMLGAGFILASHARSVAILPGAQLALIGDSSVKRAQEAVRNFRFGGSVNSIEAMAASDCDVVHILLPPGLHETAIRNMLAAGKSAFVEKPFVLSSASAEELITEADAKGARIGVNHNFLFARNYQPIRDLVRSGGLGRVDSITIDWQYQLPFIKFGPFDNWIVSGPSNPLYEVAAHPIAFALDLVGSLTIDHVETSDVARLPSGVEIPQRWRVLGHSPQGAVTINLAFTAGHEARQLFIRGEGGAVIYDYGRDIGSVERKSSENPIFDSYHTANGKARALNRQARTDVVRRIWSALCKAPTSAPFEESVFRSISAFYGNLTASGDSRHSPQLAAQTISLIESIATKAGLPLATTQPLKIAIPKPERASNVLVVGGTGFIGKALVKKLLADGHGVRVLTRGAANAAIAFDGMPVEIISGHHGDAETVTHAMEGIETVYHLAKCEGRRWQDYLDGDIEPTQVLARTAAKCGVRRFVYTGTIDSYDSANSGNRIDNSTSVDRRIAGRNLYARSKAACEAVLKQISEQTGLNLVIMRPGIVIGAGSPPAHLGVGLFKNQTEVVFWGDGRNKLPFVHVDDVADALAKAASASGIDGKTFLLTGPPIMSGQEYVNALQELSGRCIAVTEGSPFRLWVADFIKEAAKNAVRHPNRRRSTLHDWACRTHRSRYDASETETLLDWHPIKEFGELRQRGIFEALKAW